MLLSGPLSSLRESFCPSGTISSWLARRPSPAGLALIVPDNLDMLEITAGPSQMYQLHQQIGERLATIFGPDNVAGSVAMEGFLISLGPKDRSVCARLVDQALLEISTIQIDQGRYSSAVTGRAAIIWTDLLYTVRPEVVRRRLITALVVARRDHRSCVATAADDDAAFTETELTARLLCDIPAAIAENRLQLNAQDIIACASQPDAPSEVEILLQMQDRNGNKYAPASFLPAAEDSTLIEMIDRWVLHHVLGNFGPQLRAHPQLWVSINVSAPSLGNSAFLGFLADELRRSRIDPRRIQLEITETAVIRDLDQACTNIRDARRLGCRIALDDFGSGLSSFSYLKAFEPDCIKIDGALIPYVVDPENVEAQIVHSIINLAHRLDIEVVAEHVSSPAILSALRALGIDKVQGFELGRPRPLLQLFETLRPYA